jgi:UDP-glucose 4-epimerase
LLADGAGYIGSHIEYKFDEAGELDVVLDYLSTALMKHFPERAAFITGEITSDSDFVCRCR